MTPPKQPPPTRRRPVAGQRGLARRRQEELDSARDAAAAESAVEAAEVETEPSAPVDPSAPVVAGAEPAPASEEWLPAEPVAAEPGAPSWLPSALVGAAVAILAIACAFLFSSYRSGQHDDTVARAETRATAAARDGLTNALSYNYRTFDDDLARAEKGLTPTFSKQYTDLQEHTVKATAEKYQASVVAEVSAIGAVESSPDRVVLLAFV